jgi:hypothetical protein
MIAYDHVNLLVDLAAQRDCTQSHINLLVALAAQTLDLRAVSHYQSEDASLAWSIWSVCRGCQS